MTDLTFQQQVFATLTAGDRDEWTLDGDVVVSERYNAEFWFDGDQPHLEFDHFIAGHLLLEPAELTDPKAILREIDLELARWLDEREEIQGCVDPDHGIGDHPCDEVLGREEAARLRDGPRRN